MYTNKSHFPGQLNSVAAWKFIVMALEERKNNDVVEMNGHGDDFAIGTQHEVKRYTMKGFYRSVLFQMILFGA